MNVTIGVPERLDTSGSLQFARQLLALSEADCYTFDFEYMSWTEPFGMLYASEAIKHLMKRFPGAKFLVKNYESHGYPGHMGFFQAFGLDFGKKPGAATGGDNYLPLTELSIAAMYREARERDVAVGEIVDEHAARLAAVLTRHTAGALFETVQYALREIMRNTAEHARAPTLSYCAQYWPQKDRVQIGIIDAGVGIRETLSKNPFLHIESECDALKLAVMPGVSGKMYQGVEVKPYDVWQNSGYGLYMISRICRNAGSFLISSKEGTLGILKDKHESQAMNLLPGTGIRLLLNPSKFMALKPQLQIFAKEGQEVAAQVKGAQTIKASAASMMLHNQEVSA